MEIREFTEILDAGLSEARIGIVPPGIGQVQVGDIRRTRLSNIRVLFFLGLNDGWVPAHGDGGGIVTDMGMIGVGMNLLAAIPAQILLIGGACAAGFGALGWTALARPAAWCAGQMARLLRFGTSVGSRCPMLTDPDGLLTAWAALVLAAAGVLLICGASRKARRIAAICCAVLLAIPVWSGVRPREELTAVRCGDGLAVCVATGGRRT